MAITISKIGSEISTEKLTFECVSDDPAVTSVIMHIRLETGVNNHTLEHVPDFGTTDTFTFEVNSILKDYFTFVFQSLAGSGNQLTTIDNVIFKVIFNEVIGTTVQGVDYSSQGIIKNITQDAFEIEYFDFADYDCGNSGSTESKFLTSSPSPLLMGDLTSTFLSVLNTSYTGTPPTLTPEQEWVILKLDGDGVLLNTTFEDVVVPVRSIDGLSLIGAFDISTLKIDMDTSTGAYETRVYIRDKASPFTVRSETRVFKNKGECDKVMTISWMNEYGVQDTFTFNGNITRTGKYTDKTFNRSRPVNPLSTDVGDLVYKSSYNYEYDIFSDRMPENDVQWLSKVLINKRAAIQTEAVVDINLNGFLYNWYAIDNGNEANGTNNGGIVNQSQTGWRVPSGGLVSDFATLVSSAGGSGVGGGSLKRTGFDYWDSPNTGATNSTNFDAVGAGYRLEGTGAFFNVKRFTQLSSYSLNGSLVPTLAINYNNTLLNQIDLDKKRGRSIRLVRDAVGGENDGDLIFNAYTGNDGSVYNGIVIGSQVWINRSLTETKYNDGSDIPNITDDATWGSLTTGGMSVYDNGKTEQVVEGKYFPIVITSDETLLEDKFTPETLFRMKFRLANKRKGLV